MGKHMVGRLELTDAEIDDILERFDQTEPALQRRIVARFVNDRAIFHAALDLIAELDGDCAAQRFKLTRFQCAQVARRALNDCRTDGVE